MASSGFQSEDRRGEHFAGGIRSRVRYVFLIAQLEKPRIRSELPTFAVGPQLQLADLAFVQCEPAKGGDVTTQMECQVEWGFRFD